MTTPARLREIAVEHLPARDVEAWMGLLRPAAQLLPAAAGDDVVARFGGSPHLPADLAWPLWPGHGPLGYVGEVDLDALARTGIDAGITLPSTGRLLAFYFDGSYDDFDGLVGVWDPTSLVGAQLLHLPAVGGDCGERAAPDGVQVTDERSLTARQDLTAPDIDQAVLREVFGQGLADAAWWRHPVREVDFWSATANVDGYGPRHQIGGWARAVQHPVEEEVASMYAPTGDVDALRAEAARWVPLLQVDSDDAVDWGDGGTLNWVARRADLAAGDLSRVSFTWQC